MTLAIALKKTTSNLNHFLPPHYYEYLNRHIQNNIPHIIH